MTTYAKRKLKYSWNENLMLKKIVIFESGSDFAAINFDVLNSNFGGIFFYLLLFLFLR
jgi:hypothetical protein